MVGTQGVNYKWTVWAMGYLQMAGWVMGDEVMDLRPFVVEGRHFDEVAVDLPMGVKRLEREEMERSGARNVVELLERAAGVRFIDTTGNGTTGQVAMRGFGDNSGLRVLIIVDGQVYNPPDMGGINWEGIDMEELETVEILRGGQTVLYGNHAVAGIIKLTSRETSAGLSGHLTLSHGSDGDSWVRAGASAAAGGLGLRVGAGWRESDGFRENGSIASRTGNLSWTFGKAGGTRWTGRFHSSKLEMDLPGPLSYEQMLTDPRQAIAGDDDTVFNEEYQITQHGEGRTSWGSWEVAAGLLNRDRQWELAGKSADNELDRGTLNPRVKVSWQDGFVIGGIDLSWDRIGYTGYWDRDRETVLSRAEIERVTAGGYLFASIDLTGDVKLSGGMRIESAETDNEHVHYRENQLFPELETNRGTIPNPDYKSPPDADPELSFFGPVDKSGWAGEVSLLWKASERISIWTGWDRVYRYPSLDETASYQGYPLSDPLNENLEPETGDNFELGFKRVGRNWHAGLTGYVLLLNDEISFIETENTSGGGIVRLNDNLGDSTRKGVELDVLYQQDRYGANLIASFTDVHLDDGETSLAMPLVPGVEGSLTLWLKPVQNMRFQLQGRYQSSQVQGNDFQETARRIPSSFLANVLLYWDVWENCSFSLGVNNLFDRIHAMSAYSGGFYPGAGRQAYSAIKVEF